MIDLTIVIPSYETRELLFDCLDSLRLAIDAYPEIETEIIVVDNGSRDGSAMAVRANFPEVRVVAWIRNRGFAAAVNQGLRERRGRVVLLVNSDVTIERDLIATGLRTFAEHPRVGIIGPALYHSDGRPQRSVHSLPSLKTEWVPEFLLRISRPLEFALPKPVAASAPPNDLRTVEAVRGAVFFIRGDLIDSLGGLDEGFFFFLEETDFCARVRCAGHEIAFAEEMHAAHRLGASSKRRVPLATRIEYHRSLYRYFELHAGAGVARVVKLTRMLRGVINLLLLSLAFPFSSRLRQKWAERWGLFLWHLGGCPPVPTLAIALMESRIADSEESKGMYLDGNLLHQDEEDGTRSPRIDERERLNAQLR